MTDYAKANVIACFLTRIDYYHRIFKPKMILSKCENEKELDWWFCQCVKHRKVEENEKI